MHNDPFTVVNALDPETGMLTSDFLIIGGGVIGRTLALEIRRRRPETRVTIVEAERNLVTGVR